MNTSKTGRSIAVLTCVAALSTIAAPAASAASAEASTTDSSSVYTRAVSNTTPATGEIITYTQTFTTTSGKDYIYEWKNNVDSCLEYQPGSAKLTVGGKEEPLPAEKVNAQPGTTKISATDPAGYWTFSKDAPHKFALNYKVGANCKPEQKLESGFWYKYSTSWLGNNKTYAANKFNGGPAVTVVDAAKARAEVALTEAPERVVVQHPARLSAKITVAPVDGQEAPAIAGQKVNFVDGDKNLCSADINAEGLASCEWTPNQTGSAKIKAMFPGNDQVLPAESAAKDVKITVEPPVTPTELAVNPANANGKAQTVISGKAQPGTMIEALGPGGARCVDTTKDDGSFSCNLGFLPAVPGKVIVTAAREEVKSDPAEIAVNTPTGIFGSFGLPSLPNLDSPSLPMPNTPSLPSIQATSLPAAPSVAK